MPIALKHLVSIAGISAFAAFGTAHATSVPLAAEYLFNNTLASDDGAPALIATDPLGTASFSTDSVFGHSHTVYNYTGNQFPLNQQGGLTLDTTGLLTSPGNWSAELDFKFNERTDAWRRIIDVENRTSDNGFYVDPSNNLNIFPVAGTTAAFTTEAYHQVFISVGSGTAKVWLGTSAQFTISTHVMDLGQADNPGNLLNLFLDNLVAGGQQEWSSGSIAYFGFYNGALNDDDVALLSGRILPTEPPVPGVPEPATLALLGLGLAGLEFVRRRRAA